MMRDAGITTCASVDDMLVIAPRHLAPALFLRQPAVERSVPDSKLLPFGWNMTETAASTAAVKATYGERMDFAEYARICNPVTPFTVGGRNFIEWGNNSAETIRNITEQNIQVEGRMTGEVHARLLPFALVPMPYTGYNHAGGSAAWMFANTSRGTAAYC